MIRWVSNERTNERVSEYSNKRVGQYSNERVSQYSNEIYNLEIEHTLKGAFSESWVVSFYFNLL